MPVTKKRGKLLNGVLKNKVSTKNLIIIKVLIVLIINNGAWGSIVVKALRY
jgi:hypothetical protein